jgi:hypothetical protein
MTIKRIVKVTNAPTIKFSNTSSVKETKFLIFITPFLLSNKFNKKAELTKVLSFGSPAMLR